MCLATRAEEIGTGKVVTELIQDISAYVDVIDDVKKSSAFSAKYYIQDNDRPDNVSMKLYGSPSYHWTFFLMNDHLRQQGWPLSNRLIAKQLKRDFPHEVAISRDDLTSVFRPGQIVVGSTSGARSVRSFVVDLTSDVYISNQLALGHSHQPKLSRQSLLQHLLLKRCLLTFEKNTYHHTTMNIMEKE